MRATALPLLAAVALLLQACASAPAYQRPALALPASFQEGGLPWAQARPGDTLPRGDWWTLFDDPVLDRLRRRSTPTTTTCVPPPRAPPRPWPRCRARRPPARRS